MRCIHLQNLGVESCAFADHAHASLCEQRALHRALHVWLCSSHAMQLWPQHFSSSCSVEHASLHEQACVSYAWPFSQRHVVLQCASLLRVTTSPVERLHVAQMFSA